MLNIKTERARGERGREILLVRNKNKQQNEMEQKCGGNATSSMYIFIPIGSGSARKNLSTSIIIFV